jgi:hypothetical protein
MYRINATIALTRWGLLYFMKKRMSTSMSAPLETPEFNNLFVGDINDDDAAVIQSKLEPAADGPPNVYTEPIPSQAVETAPPVLDRLLGGTQPIDPAWAQPTAVLPRDEFRGMISIRVYSNTATDGVYFADAPTKLTSPDGVLFPKFGMKLLPADGWTVIGNYTGALYVTAFGSAGAVTFSVMAVTK